MLGDVGKQRDGPHLPALIVVDGRGVGQKPDQRPVGMFDAGHHVAHRAALAQRAHPGQLGARQRRAVGAEQLDLVGHQHVARLQVRNGEADQVLGGRVGADDVALHVQYYGPLQDCVEQDAEQFAFVLDGGHRRAPPFGMVIPL